MSSSIPAIGAGAGEIGKSEGTEGLSPLDVRASSCAGAVLVSSGSFKCDDVNTFKGKLISPEQAEARYAYLVGLGRAALNPRVPELRSDIFKEWALLEPYFGQTATEDNYKPSSSVNIECAASGACYTINFG